MAANFPDIDVLLGLADRDAYVFQHRGLTHSLAGLIVFSLLMAWFFRLVSPVKRFGVLFGLSLLGQASNTVMDLVNAWGTMVLWPFSRRWFALSWVGIADPFVWAILAGGLALGALRGESRAWINRAALALVAVYCFACGAAKEMGIAHFREALARVRTDPQRIESYPQLFAPLRWNVIGFLPDRYYQGYVHSLGGLEGRLCVFLGSPVPPAVASGFAESFERWAAAPLVRPFAGGKAGEVAICDLRFLGRREGMPFVVKLYLNTAGKPDRQWLGWQIAPPAADQEFELR